MRLSIGLKIGISLSVLGILSTVLTGFYTYNKAHTSLIHASQEKLLSATQALGNRFAFALKQISNDVALLATLPVVHRIANNDDAVEQSDMKKELAFIFESLLKDESNYLQVRLIGAAKHGKELVRVDHDQDMIRTVAESELKEKGYFPYFYNTVNIGGGKIYISEINLNREPGITQSLKKPTLRVASPVYRDSGEVFGIVVINVGLNSLFTELQTDIPPGSSVLLTNLEGDFLIHPDESKVFGFDKGRRFKIQDAIPEVAGLLTGGPDHIVLPSTHVDPQLPESVATFSRMLFDPQNSSRILLVGLFSPLDKELASIIPIAWQIVQITIFFSVLLTLFSLALSRKLSLPLQWMTEKIRNFKTGEQIGQLPVERKDEIGLLAQSFKSMSMTLNIQVEELETSNHQLAVAKEQIRKTFGRYLSDEIVQAILETPDGMKLGGVEQVVTIMMTDIRGFSAICERVSAEQVVSMLNQYFDVMTDIIFRYKGTIDEFMGDGILAMFGAPIQREDDAQRAVACAMEMLLAMPEVNRRNLAAGYPEINIGIGIHTGKVIVGNLGSYKRMKYGLVGHNINLTSRIESYTVGGQILISESTKNQCGDWLRIDQTMEISPKGVKEPITIYDVGGIGGPFNLFLPDKPGGHLVELAQPVAVSWTILEGKHVSAMEVPGHFVKISADLAHLQTDRACRPLTNLKLSVFDEQGARVTDALYAKVTEMLSETPPIVVLHFTSIPPEATNFFGKLTSA